MCLKTNSKICLDPMGGNHSPADACRESELTIVSPGTFTPDPPLPPDPSPFPGPPLPEPTPTPEPPPSPEPSPFPGPPPHMTSRRPFYARSSNNEPCGGVLMEQLGYLSFQSVEMGHGLDGKGHGISRRFLSRYRVGHANHY